MSDPGPIDGLANPRGVRLERWPIRTREANATLSAWRLTLQSDGEEGTITLVEASAETAFFRGDGIVLGWPQDRLASAYAALIPKQAEAPLETQQLG